MLNPNAPAMLRIAEHDEIKGNIPVVKNTRGVLAGRIKCIGFAPCFRVDEARQHALGNKRRTLRCIYRPAFEDYRSALVCQPYPSEVAVDSIGFATADGERNDKVALIDKLDHVGRPNECASVYSLARLYCGEVDVCPATVVKRSPPVMCIVVDGYVKGVREPVQRTFYMPVDSIIDHLEAIADNVRPAMQSRPRRDNRGEKKGSKPTLAVVRHSSELSCGNSSNPNTLKNQGESPSASK